MLELIGLCVIIYLIIKFGGVVLKSVLEIFLALVLFFIALPILLAIVSFILGVFSWGSYGY
mgnify:CR=1 FL=1